MRMQKRQFRIGELANKLAVEKFVIRFWEKEFNLSTTRSTGGQRFYNEDDLARFTYIKTLLYEKGFTISGAKKELLAPGTILGSQRTTIDPIKTKNPLNTDLHKQLVMLRHHLLTIRELI
jgi:DNA-binding transcriptional MerR regulator